MEVNGSNNTFTMIPKEPIKFDYDPNRRTYEIGNSIINSFYGSSSNLQSAGNAFDKYSYGQVQNGISSFLSGLKRDTYFVYRSSGSRYVSDNDQYTEYKDEACHYVYTNHFDWCNTYRYKVPKPKTLGFRPVVTLKLTKKNVTTELSNGIKIGDHIKYEANNYSNWRVLSIDEEKGTVDLVSGGVVKNVIVSGDTGYNNYSDILQDEVNAYKNGPDVVSVRPLAKSDLSNLILIKDQVNAKYWLNNKRSVRKSLQSNYYAQFYSVLTGQYNGDEIETEYIYLFIGTNMNVDNMYYFQYYTGVDSGVNNYTAGIRPVVTMKVDALKKLSNEEEKKVEKSSVIADKSFANEQANNNKSYSTLNKSITDSTSSAHTYSHDEAIRNDDKVDPSLTTSTGNNSSYGNATSSDGVCGSCLCKGYLRYIVIGIMLLIIIGILIAILLGLIYRKIDNIRR